MSQPGKTPPKPKLKNVLTLSLSSQGLAAHYPVHCRDSTLTSCVQNMQRSRSMVVGTSKMYYGHFEFINLMQDANVIHGRHTSLLASLFRFLNI